ncbi:cell division cycle-associated protein 2 isoform X1 [Sander vitreus]
MLQKGFKKLLWSFGTFFRRLVGGSPFLPRVASTLRQKMASFQSLMDVEESEVCDPMPRQDSNTGGCIKTRDYLSDGNSHNGGKENYPPMMMPVPSKRRRLAPQEGCEVEIREGSTPISNFSLKKHEDSLFELESLGRPPPDDAAAASPAAGSSSSPFHIPSVSSLLEMKPTGEDDSTGTSTVKKAKKRVHFGGPLSPEFFDKNLPPSTPLQKGGTPGRAPTPGGSLQPRPVLKTPQRSESQTPQAQPDPSSPSGFGASPTLAMPRNRRMPSVGEDGEEKDGEIVFPAMEEIDSAVTRDTECTWDPQPLNLNTAFNEESLSQILSESEIKPSTTSQMDALDEPTAVPEKEKQHEVGVKAPAQSRNRRKKKQPGPEHVSSGEAPARSGSLKRKQPEESEPGKRSTRSAAKSAAGKMKMTSTATRRWSRGVDRSLYGSRAFASKNPNLSPITETLSLISRSAAAPHTPSASCTGANHETHLNPEMANDTQGMGNITVTNALEDPSEDSVTSPNSIKESPTGDGRGPRARGRALQKRKVSVADDSLFCEETVDQTGVKTKESCEDQTTPNLQASRETPLNPTVPEQGEVNTEDIAHIAQTSADTHCTDSDGKLQCRGSLDAPSSDYPPLAFTLSLPAEPAQRKAKRGRRSSVNRSVLREQGHRAEEHPTSHEVEEKGQADQAASQQENIRPSSDSQEVGGVAGLDLAPWQADFNFEDVFRPVATRGQRSVRRSLRNKCNAEQSSTSAGLAWLPWTSPESNSEARRKTRGRRLSAAPPVQPPLPEETQDGAS